MNSIKPIRTEADYKEALATIEKYFDAQAGTSEGDLVEVLSILIEDYESKHFPVSLPDPIEAILYHLDSRGLNRQCLESYLGGRGRVSEILNKKRPLTMEMIRKIHKGLGISLEILLQKYMDEPGQPVSKVVISKEPAFRIDLNTQGPAWVAASLDTPIYSFPDTRKMPLANSNTRSSRSVKRATFAS